MSYSTQIYTACMNLVEIFYTIELIEDETYAIIYDVGVMDDVNTPAA